MPYWAVKPVGREDAIRIEKAPTGRDACLRAFGRELFSDGHQHADHECNKWLCKNLGNKVAPLRSNKQRMALLLDPNGWVDPYEYRKKLVPVSAKT